MRWSTLRSVVVVVIAVAVGGCGFAPGATGTGAQGSGNRGGPLGTGASTGAGLVGGGAAQNGNGGNPGMNCASVDNPLNKLPPDILIVLDASGSMNEDSENNDCGGNGCGANSKWALLTPALNQVVMQTQANVNWGLKLFADTDSACGVGANSVAVPVAPNNAAAIATVIANRTDPEGNVTMGSRTPTRAAENAAVAYMNTVQALNPKFILMATDGQPNCPASGNSSNDDSPGAIMAVANALTAGFPTFVVGISAPAGAANDALNGMANAGGYPRMGTPQYYPVTSAAEFVAVLDTLVTIAGTCVFPVPEPPNTDTDRNHIGVKVNGNEIPHDTTHTNGWDYTSDAHTAVQIYGPNCDAIEAGTVQSVQVVFKCIIN
jgi:hypothetical protein